MGDAVSGTPTEPAHLVHKIFWPNSRYIRCRGHMSQLVQTTVEDHLAEHDGHDDWLPFSDGEP